MIYKKDLLSKIESLESQIERFRGTNYDKDIKKVDKKINLLLNYLQLEITTEKSIENGEDELSYTTGGYRFIVRQGTPDTIKYTDKITKKSKEVKKVKKTKKTKKK